MKDQARGGDRGGDRDQAELDQLPLFEGDSPQLYSDPGDRERPRRRSQPRRPQQLADDKPDR
jgi:hypothetical protein